MLTIPYFKSCYLSKPSTTKILLSQFLASVCAVLCSRTAAAQPRDDCGDLWVPWNLCCKTLVIMMGVNSLFRRSAMLIVASVLFMPLLCFLMCFAPYSFITLLFPFLFFPLTSSWVLIFLLTDYWWVIDSPAPTGIILCPNLQGLCCHLSFVL